MFEDVLQELDKLAENSDNLDNLTQIRELLENKGTEFKNLQESNQSLTSKVSELRDVNQKLYIKASGIQPVKPEGTKSETEEIPKLSPFEKISQGLGNTNDTRFITKPTIKFGDFNDFRRQGGLNYGKL